MDTYRAIGSALINAPAEQVYALIADYHNGHPKILPKPYFSDLKVEQGGVGAGTLIHLNMSVMGKTQTFRAAITEPEPGRVLVESNLPDGPVTIFTVMPVAQGQQAQVTITTEGKTRRGLPGLLERLLTPIVLQRIYQQELQLLAALAEEHAGALAANTSTAA